MPYTHLSELKTALTDSKADISKVIAEVTATDNKITMPWIEQILQENKEIQVWQPALTSWIKVRQAREAKDVRKLTFEIPKTATALLEITITSETAPVALLLSCTVLGLYQRLKTLDEANWRAPAILATTKLIQTTTGKNRQDLFSPLYQGIIQWINQNPLLRQRIPLAICPIQEEAKAEKPISITLPEPAASTPPQPHASPTEPTTATPSPREKKSTPPNGIKKRPLQPIITEFPSAAPTIGKITPTPPDPIAPIYLTPHPNGLPPGYIPSSPPIAPITTSPWWRRICQYIAEYFAGLSIVGAIGFGVGFLIGFFIGFPLGGGVVGALIGGFIGSSLAAYYIGKQVTNTTIVQEQEPTSPEPMYPEQEPLEHSGTRIGKRLRLATPHPRLHHRATASDIAGDSPVAPVTGRIFHSTKSARSQAEPTSSGSSTTPRTPLETEQAPVSDPPPAVFSFTIPGLGYKITLS